jgi:pimeloyl-ACP methyl ester carboxylesterase
MSSTVVSTEPTVVWETATSLDGTAIGHARLGSGPGLLVLGGAWRSGRDYLRLGQALAHTYTVHLVDRRGRAHSGPQGPAYGMSREVEDLLVVQRQTGATVVFGHSYGGLIALEAARQSEVFSDVIVYEPGVSVAGSIPLGWIPTCRRKLDAGDAQGAFAAMVRGMGAGPPITTHMPLWYLKLVLRLFIKRQERQEIEDLAEVGYAEHQQVAAVDDGSVQRYQTVAARTLLLGGSNSPSFMTTTLFEQLVTVIPDSASEIIDGLDHLAPDRKAPDVVAEHVLRHLGEQPL